MMEAVPTPNRIKINVGTSTIPTYSSGGQVQVTTTNIFPDGTRPSGEFFKVISSANQIKTILVNTIASMLVVVSSCIQLTSSHRSL